MIRDGADIPKNTNELLANDNNMIDSNDRINFLNDRRKEILKGKN